MSHKRYQILSGFWIKLIALVTMTCDHVGAFMEIYQQFMPDAISNVATYEAWMVALRCIGRIAYPLFLMLLVDGVRHTSNFKKYLLRLSIVGGIILLPQIVIYFFDPTLYVYSPFIDLIVFAIMLYLLKRKDKYSFFAIIPFTVTILSFVAMLLEAKEMNALWFPYFLRVSYSIYGLLLVLGFYFAYPVARKLLLLNENTKTLVDTCYERTLVNVLNMLTVFVSVLVIYLLNLIPDMENVFLPNRFMVYGLLSGAFLFLYNGLRGYNKRWFKIGSYIYFPAHLIIIGIIFGILILGGLYA